MTRFAATTEVPVERSAAEIERTLQRYGADRFMRGWDHDRAMIGFVCNGRQIRFILPLPSRDEKQFTHVNKGRHYESWHKRTPEAALKAWEQACRQRWRALALCIKAKLEAVEAGITTFEEEFMAHIVLPDGTTVGQFMTPQIEHAYQHGHMPPLLPAGGQS